MKSLQKLKFILVLLVIGCTPSRIYKTTYESVEKKSKMQTEQVKTATVSPLKETPQLQKEGSVSISAEIVRFSLNTATKSVKRLVASDNVEFDKYEISERPAYTITPENIVFNIRVMNGGKRILKLRDVALMFQVDDDVISLKDEGYEDWVNGLILPGKQKSFEINGPSIKTLPDSCLVGIYLYDIPVSYDQAGTILKKQNFEWFFQYSITQSPQQFRVNYDYSTVPVYKETCTLCKGQGHSYIKCSGCGGTGKVKNKDGNTVKHYRCSGTGSLKNDCRACTAGKIPRRKSPDPAIAERWSGYPILVKSTPPGARVSIANPSTGEYEMVGGTNKKVQWWETSRSGSKKTYPIKIEWNGEVVYVKPYNSSHKVIPSVMVDFTTGKPIVTKGVPDKSPIE